MLTYRGRVEEIIKQGKTRKELREDRKKARYGVPGPIPKEAYPEERKELPRLPGHLAREQVMKSVRHWPTHGQEEGQLPETEVLFQKGISLYKRYTS